MRPLDQLSGLSPACSFLPSTRPAMLWSHAKNSRCLALPAGRWTMTRPCAVRGVAFQTARSCRSSDSTSMARLRGTFASAIQIAWPRWCAYSPPPRPWQGWRPAVVR